MIIEEAFVIYLTGLNTGTVNDRSLYTNSSLFLARRDLFLPHQYVFADSGYIGEGNILASPKKSTIQALEGEEKEAEKILKHVISVHRSIIENVFAFLKNEFAVLNQISRFKNYYSLDVTFYCCCLLANYLSNTRDNFRRN